MGADAGNRHLGEVVQQRPHVLGILVQIGEQLMAAQADGQRQRAAAPPAERIDPHRPPAIFRLTAQALLPLFEHLVRFPVPAAGERIGQAGIEERVLAVAGQDRRRVGDLAGQEHHRRAEVRGLVEVLQIDPHQPRLAVRRHADGIVAVGRDMLGAPRGRAKLEVQHSVGVGAVALPIHRAAGVQVIVIDEELGPRAQADRRPDRPARH